MSPRLRLTLRLIFLLFALLVVNSAYLGGVTLAEHLGDRVLQDPFYLSMFLVHLALGLILVLPVVIFGVLHMRRAWRRPNRYAVRAGLGLYLAALAVLASGIVLTRFGFFEVNDPSVRDSAYWVHVAAPFLVVWLFVLHRLAGPRIRWRVGGAWSGAAAVFAVAMVGAHLMTRTGTGGGHEQPFLPALVQTAQAQTRIPPAHLMDDETCAECHGDIAAQAAQGVHRLSSFNNPAYRFSIDEARRVVLERDGDVRATRLCAGCHDLVPLLSGAFDDPEYDPDTDPGASAGITCLGCHAITRMNGPRGNADYTIVDPPRYPLAFSDNAFLRAVSRQLIKAKPAFHKKTLLKPMHRTAEFCSGCHKVHLPYELNHYKWLRGQNHYDSFLLSGVSGHRVDSFYYPDRAAANCAQCHMPLTPSEDPAARRFADAEEPSVHSHIFPAANTAVPEMVGLKETGNQARRTRLEGTARVDIFGLKPGGGIDGELIAPLRPEVPVLEPGRRYLLESVVRTLKIGHQLTQGTIDSNELWLDVTVRDADRVIGRSGGLDADGTVDPWSYFINGYILDRQGNRIDRRNAHDIVVALYDHQIPPGAASVVHYALEVPPDARGPITVEVRLKYRKFDTRFLRHVEGPAFDRNDLPVTTLAADRLTFPVADTAPDVPAQASDIPVWQRWNDYGIGLLREGNSGSSKGELRQAEEAFGRVEALGRPDGPLNLARAYYKEGRLQAAAEALQRAAAFDPPAPPWTLAWYSALIEREYGNLDRAIELLEDVAGTRFADARRRGFDFGRDYRLLNELGRTLFDRARQERGAGRGDRRAAYLERARKWLNEALSIDPENLRAHYTLALVLADLGDSEGAARHRALHEKYRPDDHAREQAVAIHRSRNPAADHAAEPIAIYDLQRREAFGLEWPPQPPGNSLAGRTPDPDPSP
ncbi:MAG: aspartate phosphatase [Chromatiales bacterium]